jgi:hypothetical protein
MIRAFLAASLLLAASTGSSFGQDASARVQAEAQQYLGLCALAGDDQRWCEVTKEAFLQDYVKAKAGDYQGQRNVAYLLNRGQAPVRQNRIQGCAWRSVILASGHAQSDSVDTANLRIECSGLAPEERQASQARASALLQEIRSRSRR